MTTHTEPTEHPAPEELSELAENLLPPQHSTTLHEHLARCADCAEVYSSLGEIRALLGALPAPPPLPADVSSRLDEALRREAEETGVSRETCEAAPSATVADVPRETSRPEPTPDIHVSRETCTPPFPLSRRDVPRETSRRTRPAPSRPSPPAPRRTSTGGRSRRRLLWGGTATVLALGAGSLLLSSLGTGDDEQVPSARPSSSQQSEQFLVFSGSPLRTEVSTLLQDSEASAPINPKNAGTASASPRQPQGETGAETPLRADAPVVPPCVTRGIGREETALGVEKGTYRGHEAYLVVLPHSRDTAQVTAYIVDAACAALRTATKGEVLLTSSYPR